MSKKLFDSFNSSVDYCIEYNIVNPREKEVIMTEFRGFTYIEHFGKPEVDSILNKQVIIQPKLDGINASVWYDNGVYYYGSRGREVRIENDNSGFTYYMSHSTDPEVAVLHEYCRDHPNHIIYGEFLGTPGGKFLGAIKDYLEGGFFVFDVYDTDKRDYLPWDMWYVNLHDTYGYHRCVPVIFAGKVDSIEQVKDIAEKANYNLPDGVTPEGVVVKGRSRSCRDSWGNILMGKLVLAEYLWRKKDNRTSEGVKQSITGSELEDKFVENYCTNAFLAKEQQKILIALGDDTWINDSKYISMFVNKIVDELMEEEFWGFFHKNLCIVDLGRLKHIIQDSCRKFLGLI